jgi:hypothetical protein
MFGCTYISCIAFDKHLWLQELLKSTFPAAVPLKTAYSSDAQRLPGLDSIDGQ